MSRRQAREIALQALYQLDVNPPAEGADVGGAVRYAVMVLFAGAVWPMTFHPLCCAMKKQIY